MSTALAIASVTFVLKDLLNNGIIDKDVSETIRDAVTVTAYPPDMIKLDGTDRKSGLNLFMYLATPNQAWRNVELPSRDGAGERRTAPPLGLDLHYLLTAYGFDELHSEILLGYGMQLMHENPVLSRADIRKSLTSPAATSSHTVLPEKLRALSASSLADQVEAIKITLQPMNIEEMSKLWTAFSSKYRPTAAYQVSVVLIESDLSTKRPLPVLQPQLYVAPFKQPRVTSISSQSEESKPVLANAPILSGDRLILEGKDLRGETTAVKIDGAEIDAASILAVGDTRIILVIPAQLKAGVRQLQVVHKLMMGLQHYEKEHRSAESPVAAFVLSPCLVKAEKVAGTMKPGDGDQEHSFDLLVTFKPAVGKRQRVVLFLNKAETSASSPAKGYSFRAPEGNGIALETQDETVTVKFGVKNVVAGQYFLRVQVDGAESPVNLDPAGIGLLDIP